MTKAIFIYKEDKIIKIEIVGHANYDRHGKDIICASISALSYSALIGITELTDAVVAFDDDEPGMMLITVLLSSKECQLLLKSLKLGLEQISNQYGENYIEVREEVSNG